MGAFVKIIYFINLNHHSLDPLTNYLKFMILLYYLTNYSQTQYFGWCKLNSHLFGTGVLILIRSCQITDLWPVSGRRVNVVPGIN